MMVSKRICLGLCFCNPRHILFDDGFKENMSRIAEAHPNSPMAQTYGSNRNHKEIKTYNAITKHAKSIGKSHDLNAISKEYKQGQLVK